MKIKTLILVVVLIAISVATAQTIRLYLDRGQGNIYWEHSGLSMDGSVEEEIAFEVMLKNLGTGSITTLMHHPYPPPTSDAVAQFIIPVDRYVYDVGIVAYDANGNRSDTTWAGYTMYTFTPDTIPPEPCGLIVCSGR